MEVHELLQAVTFDLDRGVFDNFPILKIRFNKLAKRLDYIKRVINADGLTHVELKLLIENDYINKNTVITNTKK